MSTIVSSSPITKAAVFVTGTKGGPGKSTFSILLTDYYRTRSIVVAAHDGDHGNQTFTQHFGLRDEGNPRRPLISDQDPCRGVSVFNIREPRERDIMLNVIEGNADRIVIDLPGGGSEDVAAVLNDTDLFFQTFVDAGIRPIVVVVMSTVKASAVSVPATIDLFGPVPHYIAVRNRAFTGDFLEFDGPLGGPIGNPRRLLEAAGGVVIDMPALEEETYLQLDRASVPPYIAELRENRAQTGMNVADCARIKAWRAAFAHAVAGTALAE